MTDQKLRNQIYFAGGGQSFNGSFSLGVLTLRQDDTGVWRVHVTASNEPDFSYASEAFASPRAAIAALDSLFYPWLHNSMMIVAVLIVVFVAYQVGWSNGNHEGIQTGHETEFNSLCGFSMNESSTWVQQNIPDHDHDRVPAYVQRYCVEELQEQQMLSSEGPEK